MRVTCITLLFAACVAAQTATQTQTFDLANKPGTHALEEATTILRVVGGLTHVSMDRDTSSVKITGISHALSMPRSITSTPAQPMPFPKPLLVPGKSATFLRVF